MDTPQQRVEPVFALLAVDQGGNRYSDEVERELSQWYGDRRLAM